MKDEWNVKTQVPPAPKVVRQASTAGGELSEGEGRSADTYCFELLSMLIGLSQSEIGCGFLSQQETLVQDLFTLLHVGNSRMQLQVSKCPDSIRLLL